MKIFHKKGDILEVKNCTIVFPTGVYDNKFNNILGKFLRNHMAVKHYLLYDIANKMLNMGTTKLFDYERFSFVAIMVVFLNYDNNILKENNNRIIDYDSLYDSLVEFREYVINKGLFKVAICIDDFIDIGCDENIFEAMLKSIFKDIPVNIIIYGKLQ